MKTTEQRYGELNQSIEEYRNGVYFQTTLRGVFRLVAVAVGSFSVLVLLESILRLGPVLRTIGVITAVVLMAGCASMWVLLPVLRRMRVIRSRSRDDNALEIGALIPNVRDRMLNALHVYETRGASRTSAELSEYALDQLYDELSANSPALNFSALIDRTQALRARRFLIGMIAGFGIIWIVASGPMLEASRRVLHCTARYDEPNPYRFIVTPGSREILRGADVPVAVRVDGPPIKKITIHLMRTADDRESFVLRNDTGSTFRMTVSSLRMSTEYYADAAGFESEHYRLTVVDRPLIKRFRLLITPPSYSRLPPRYLDENAGDCAVLPGTKAEIEITSSKPLRSAAIMFSDSTTLPLTLDASDAHGSLILNKNRDYKISITDTGGTNNADPIRYSIRMMTDEVPDVKILDPGKNTDIDESLELPLTIGIKDDYGFSSLRLGYRLIQSRYESPWVADSFVTIPLHSKDSCEQILGYLWSLKSLNAVPEDAFAYFAEVFDNDAVNGPKSSRSQTFIVRLPSAEEIAAGVEQQHSDVTKDLSQAQENMKKAEQLKQELDRELKKGDKADWTDRQKIDAMSKQFKELQKNVENAVQKLDSLVSQMQENKMLSPETMEKYNELQQLMREMDSKAIQQALQRMQQSAQNADMQQMRDAMKNLTMNEDAIRQSLERTMNLLKRIQIEQKVDELTKRAADLRNEQDDLRKQTSQTNPSDRQALDKLAQKQEHLESQLKDIQKDLAALKQKMEPFGNEMPLDQMSKAQQHMADNQTSSKMKKSRGSLQQGNMSDAQQSQQETSDDLSELEQDMANVQRQMQQNQKREVLNKFKKSINDILGLSKSQEDLKREVMTMDPNSQRFRDAGRQQSNLMEGLGNVASDLNQLSQKTFAVTPEMGKQISDAYRSMDQSMAGIEGRNAPQAQPGLEGAMTSLNKLALSLRNSMNALQQGQSGGSGMMGLLQQLQSMAGQQMSLNSLTRQLQSQGMSPQQAEQYSRLSAKQSALQKSLEQLSEEARQSAGAKKALGDLNKISEEMKEIVKDMQSGTVSEETLRRQDRIVSRLLDASRSANQRDYEQRRTAEAGTTPARTSPPPLLPERAVDQMQRDLQRAREEGYSRDYQELIRRYYELLRQQ